MNIDTLRSIDRLAGVPLCAFVTVLLRVWESVRIRPERAVRRILFIELSEMGSTILAEPAMRKARATASGAVLRYFQAQREFTRIVWNHFWVERLHNS